MYLKVGARSSRLSRIQVSEIYGLIAKYRPDISFEPTYLSSPGDRDQITPLGPMDKTDFFTRDVDHLLLEKEIRLAVHSAKDLPAPLPPGLKLIALTEGVSKFDALVFPEGETYSSLPEDPIIGVSSPRREAVIRAFLPDADCREIRGTIERRLEQMEEGDYDAVIIAEAALIRLGIRHLYRIRLPGETAPLQGQLALVAREDDREIAEIFKPIDSRRKNAIAHDALLRL